jgi:Adenylate cyclase, class 2 (thermophilic)
MPLEIEIKYLDVDHEALRRRLKELGARFLNRGFESNVVYDTQERSLKAASTLLRLREKNSRFTLTLKRAAEGAVSATAKVYEECETEIVSAPGLRGILAGLGYAPALRYEKLREKWELLGCEVCLDTLPFGCFAEIEGDEDGIAACAEALLLPREKASTATYHELNRQHRLKAALPFDESFTFSDADKAKVLARRATD